MAFDGNGDRKFNSSAYLGKEKEPRYKTATTTTTTTNKKILNKRKKK